MKNLYPLAGKANARMYTGLLSNLFAFKLTLKGLLTLLISFGSLFLLQAQTCTFNQGPSITVSENFNDSLPPYTASFTALGAGLGAIADVQSNMQIEICFWGDMDAPNETWQVVISGQTFNAGGYGVVPTSAIPVCEVFNVLASNVETDLADGDIDISYQSFGLGWVAGATSDPDNFSAQVISADFNYNIPVSISSPSDRCTDAADITFAVSPQNGTATGDITSLDIFPATSAFNSSTGVLDVSAADPDSYNIVYSYTFDGCTYTAETDVEIFETPVVNLQETIVECASEGGTVDLS
ncbi:MAG: hypothetical protein AAFU60_15390, partial [Bacteroidota bacterium]